MTATQIVTLCLAGISVATAIISAWYGIRTYQRNARTKAAEFLTQLHQAFFVDKTYKRVRQLLDIDQPEDSNRLQRLIAEESSDFTDFLNFFELVAYFVECGTLLEEDAEALLEYYLDILDSTPILRAYIGRPDRGFQHLNRLLHNRRQADKEM